MGSRFSNLNDFNHGETSIMNDNDEIMIGNNNIAGISSQEDPKVTRSLVEKKESQHATTGIATYKNQNISVNQGNKIMLGASKETNMVGTKSNKTKEKTQKVTKDKHMTVTIKETFKGKPTGNNKCDKEKLVEMLGHRNA